MKRIATIFLVVILLAVTLTGCQKNAVPAANSTGQSAVNSNTIVNALPEPEYLAKLDDHLASAKEKSDTLKASLENDALTQTDMNRKAQELYELWEAALSYVLDEAKNNLPEDEWTKLTDEQKTWIKEKGKAAEAAGKEVEGGSLYALTVSIASARITEERVYELYKLLK